MSGPPPRGGGPARAAALAGVVGAALVVWAASAGAPLGSAPDRAPVLALRLRCGETWRTAADPPARLSNLEAIRLEAALHSFELPDPGSPGPLDLVLPPDEDGRGGNGPPNLEVQVTRVDAGGPVLVDGRIHPLGASAGPEPEVRLPEAGHVSAVSLVLWIPPGEARQAEILEQFRDALRVTGRQRELLRLERLARTDPERARRFFVLEHQPGVYEVTGRYRPRPGDHGPGTVRSAPLTVRIVERGHAFHRIMAPSPSTGRPPACE